MSFAKESGHWYSLVGEPAYTTISANGEPRNTTLRDARKHQLVRSVTTILNIRHQEGLQRWKMNQVLESALTLPKLDGETLDEFALRVKSDSEEHARQARERGIRAHAILETWFRENNDITETDAEKKILSAVIGTVALVAKTGKWECEYSFASAPGFGGKIDLINFEAGVILDFKTKEFDAGDVAWHEAKVTRHMGFDSHPQQLAAYAIGSGLAPDLMFNDPTGVFDDCWVANVFVSVTEPGLVYVDRYMADELERAWHIFYHLVAVAIYEDKHDPYGCFWPTYPI